MQLLSKRDKKQLRMILEDQEEFLIGTKYDPHKTLYVFKTGYKDFLHKMRSDKDGLLDIAYYYCTKSFYCLGTHSIPVHSTKSKYRNLHRFSGREG
jgi:hypothetical protein